MKSNTTAAKQVPIFLIVDDRKIALDSANLSLERRAADGTFQITGTCTDMGQIADLATYIQSIPVDLPVEAN